MSVFFLKLLAITCMALDHLAGIGESWNLLSEDTVSLFHGLGRIAFPIFAFLIVNGYHKTKNVNQYIFRLSIFAMISQIPFTLALYEANRMCISATETYTIFRYHDATILVIVLLALYWYLSEKALSPTLFSFLFFLILPEFSLKLNGIWLSSGGELNVFYTLTAALVTIDQIKQLQTTKPIKSALRILLVILLNIYICTRSDYGIYGVLLILLMSLTNKHLIRLLIIAVWSFVFYGVIIGNVYNTIFSMMSVIPLCLYNRKRGPQLKFAFYSFYPAHLLVFGFMNILYRLNIALPF
jgi:hypothetical protein